MDPRGLVPFPSQERAFIILLSPHALANQAHSDKSQLRETITLLRQQGQSFREIGHVLGIDSSRVWQIIKLKDKHRLE